MAPDYKRFVTALGAGAVLAMPSMACAQSIAYGNVVGSATQASDTGGDASKTDLDDGGNGRGSGRQGGVRRVKVTPYIEAQQVAFADFKAGGEVLTYSVLSAGIDAGVSGRNNQASISARYERRFGWNKAKDNDAYSGVARASLGILPQAVQLETGAVATRTAIAGNGAVITGSQDFGDNVTQVYSVYAGPQLATRVGNVAVNGSYRAGYTRLDSPDMVTPGAANPTVDLFDESITHNAAIRAGIKPGDGLPVGIGVGGGYNREDISNLDQRIEDRWARGDVTIPVSPELHLVGGVGYEKVQVSSRDAVRNPVTGAPVRGADGRLVTDKTTQRTLAYNADGLIWDAGLVWRPNRRVGLSAHVGRRYGSTSYYGSFAYAPTERSSFNVSAYDSIDGIGGQLNKALASLPTDFEAVRNPFNGSLGGCVAAGGSIDDEQSPCLTNALGSVRSSVFRARGVMASYGYAGNRVQFGLGAGYDRRKFIAAPGTVLAAANGVVDENIWVAAYLNGRIDRNSSFSTSVHGNLFESGDALAGETSAIGATAAYYRQLTKKLTASAAVGVDGIKRENLPEAWSGQAMVGVRYSF